MAGMQYCYFAQRTIRPGAPQWPPDLIQADLPYSPILCTMQSCLELGTRWMQARCNGIESVWMPYLAPYRHAAVDLHHSACLHEALIALAVYSLVVLTLPGAALSCLA